MDSSNNGNSNYENDHAAQRLVILETKLDITNKTLEQVQETLQKVQKEIIHYKGWVGGIIFVLSAIAAAIHLFKEWILNR